MLELSYLTCLPFHDEAPPRQITGRHFQLDFVSGRQAGKAQAGLAGNIRQHPVSVGQFYSTHLVRQNLNYVTFNFDGTFSSHVKISGSDSVINTVCSKWADSEPSCVTAVQPSFNIFTPGPPALTIGSIAKVIPGRNLGEDFPSTKFGTWGS
jgi:hypothetical protein